MISLTMALDTRRAKQDNTYPIVFRLSYNGHARALPTGFSCSKDQWNAKSLLIQAKTAEQKVINDRLQQAKADMLQRTIDYQHKYKTVRDFKHLKSFLTQEKQKVQTVTEFWRNEIQRLKDENSVGNADIYREGLTRLEKLTSLNIPFEDVNYGSLTKLETAMKKKGLSTNTISVTMRTFRAVYNTAIKTGVVDFSHYPFRSFKIKKGVTSPRPITLKEMQDYFSHSPVKASTEYDYWNYGKLIFMLRGINFADLAMLKHSNIKNGRIVYTRCKTHKVYSIKVLPEVQTILDEYMCPWRSTLLPILDDKDFVTAEKLHTRIDEKLNTTNKWLKRIKVSKEPITTYVFRYSHANICKKLNYSKDMISESLGHGYGMAVSSSYLESYDLELIDEMNERVCRTVIDRE